MEQVRIFIAVHIPAEIRSRLSDIGKRLMASGADVKWVAESNFHITLKFLGNIEPERLESVREAVGDAVTGIAPFDISLSGVGAFPKPTRPSVLWVGISAGSEELIVIARRIEDRLEQIGFAREDRPFSPHITVGRVKSSKNTGRLREIIERMPDEHTGSYRVESVTIMRSDLRPTGPVYTAIADCTLK